MPTPPERMKRILATIPVIASLLFPSISDATEAPPTGGLNAPADSMQQWRAFIEFREQLIDHPQLRQALFHDTQAAAQILEQRIYNKLIADGLSPQQAAAQTDQVSVVLHEIAALDPAERQELYDYIQTHPIESASSVAIAVASVIAVALAVKVAIAVQSAAAVQAAIIAANVNIFANANLVVNVNGTGAEEAGEDVGEDAGEDVGEDAEDDADGGSFIEPGTFGDDFGDTDDRDTYDSLSGGDLDGGGDDVIDVPIGANGYATEPGVLVSPTVLAVLTESLGELSDHRKRTLLRRILSSNDGIASVHDGTRKRVVYEYRSKQIEVTARLDRRRNVFHVVDVKIV